MTILSTWIKGQVRRNTIFYVMICLDNNITARVSFSGKKIDLDFEVLYFSSNIVFKKR